MGFLVDVVVFVVSAVLLLSLVSGECGGNVVVGGQAVQRGVGFDNGEERCAKSRKRHPLSRFWIIWLLSGPTITCQRDCVSLRI